MSGTVITGKAGLWFFQLAQHRYALQVEVDTGMKHSRGSVLASARAKYGIKARTKRQALIELTAMCDGAQDEQAGRGPQRQGDADYMAGYVMHATLR